MASHKIRITVPNSAAGIPPANTGIMGMVMKGVAATGLALDTPFLLNSPTAAAAIGITAAYDVTNGTAVFKQINEFYNQAGIGALLWIQITAKANAFAAYASSIAFDSFVRFTAQADPTQQAKVIGICYDVPTVTQAATDFPADVPAAVTAFQNQQAIHFQKGYPYSVIVDGYNMSSTVTPSTIGTQATNTAYAVSLCITGTTPSGNSSVGMALGKLVRISIGRGMGAVEDGSINTTTAFLTNSVSVQTTGVLIVGHTYTVFGGTVLYNAVTYNTGNEFVAVTGHTTFTTADTGYVADNATPIVGMSPDDLDALGLKQYLFITTVQGISGLFWNDGATCTATSNFFSDQAYNRVMNSLAYDARAFFTLLRGLNLPSDVQSGALDPVFCAAKEKSFYTIYIGPLSNNSGSGDISDGSITVTGPTYSTTAELDFEIDLVRSTILGDVNGVMRFKATL